MLINFDICGFECNIVWATKLDHVKVHYFRSTRPILQRIYVEKFRYLYKYQMKNKTDTRGLPIVHFFISSNANMYERHDWHRSADG
jgi:hypothetical protein